MNPKNRRITEIILDLPGWASLETNNSEISFHLICCSTVVLRGRGSISIHLCRCINVHIHVNDTY